MYEYMYMYMYYMKIYIGIIKKRQIVYLFIQISKRIIMP